MDLHSELLREVDLMKTQDFKKAKVLVTGGAGFIGSNIVDGLIHMGHSVIAVDSLITGSIENLSPLALFYQQDITDEKVMEKIFNSHKPDFVIHTAAQISVPASVENPVFDAQQNIMGTLTVLKMCQKYGTKKIIFSSTGGAVYGESVPIPTTEDTCPNPISPYAIAKLSCEKYIEFYSRQHGLDYTVLRYSNVFGPRQIPKGEAGVVCIFTENMLKNKEINIYGNGEQTRDFIYVGDVVMANLKALMNGSGEKINISTNTPTTINGLFKVLSEKIGYSSLPIYKDERAGDIKDSLLSNSKAKKVLSWEPKYDLEKGVGETVDWYKTII